MKKYKNKIFTNLRAINCKIENTKKIVKFLVTYETEEEIENIISFFQRDEIVDRYKLIVLFDHLDNTPEFSFSYQKDYRLKEISDILINTDYLISLIGNENIILEAIKNNINVITSSRTFTNSQQNLYIWNNKKLSYFLDEIFIENKNDLEEIYKNNIFSNLNKMNYNGL